MNALFLGGNSLRHQIWVHEVANTLGRPFESVIVHDYRHWVTGDTWVDIEHEVDVISKKMSELQPYVVFAKSIGTTIALKAMYDRLIEPKACLFLGLPLNAITDMDLPVIEWLEAVSIPLYFLHNDNDPYGSVKELRDILPSNIDQTRVTELPGDTHDYYDTAIMSELLTRTMT